MSIRMATRNRYLLGYSTLQFTLVKTYLLCKRLYYDSVVESAELEGSTSPFQLTNWLFLQINFDVNCFNSSTMTNTSYSNGRMKLSITILLCIFASTHASKKLCVKQKKTNSPPIAVTSNFRDFVEKSDVFIDKTLYFKEILEWYSVLMISRPHGWGKSLTLDMIKTFVEIPIDSNGTVLPVNQTWSYNFFKYGKITTRDGTQQQLLHPPNVSYFHEHLDQIGKWPVIYLDCKKIKPLASTYQGFMEAFDEALSNLFHQYPYLLGMLENLAKNAADSDERYVPDENLRKFKLYLNREGLDEKKIAYSIEFLGEMLHYYHVKDSYVFLEDLDALIYLIFVEMKFSSEDLEKITDLISEFVDTSFEMNTYMYKSFISTSVGIDLKGFFDITHHHIVFDSRPDDYTYYGFTQPEAVELLTHLDYPADAIKDVKWKYLGYRIGNPYLTIYSPWSIVSYANSHKLANYLPKNDKLVQLLFKTLKFDRVRKAVNVLLDHQHINLKLKLKFTPANFTAVANLTRSEPRELNSDEFHLVMSFFFATGYLTVTEFWIPEARRTPVKISTLEAEEEFQKHMSKYTTKGSKT